MLKVFMWIFQIHQPDQINCNLAQFVELMYGYHNIDVKLHLFSKKKKNLSYNWKELSSMEP